MFRFRNTKAAGRAEDLVTLQAAVILTNRAWEAERLSRTCEPLRPTVSAPRFGVSPFTARGPTMTAILSVTRIMTPCL